MGGEKNNSSYINANDSIAIIGWGCRFPGGANSPELFWKLLHEGVDAITEVPKDRWNTDAFYDPDLTLPGKMNTRWGGFLENVDMFDAPFFGISRGEATNMDPQQRLLLEVAWEALENAGQAPDTLRGSTTSVFIGMGSNDYASLSAARRENINAYFPTGHVLCVAANRLSHFFDLRGPSFVIDSGCSSSLLAAHIACQNLRYGECDLAMAGGVNLILTPDASIGLSQAWMLSSQGCCKGFDAAADGYVRGEGCGMVILKRLSDAISDRDPVLAVIRGTAVNQDGGGSNLTAPNGLALQAAIRQALENAGRTASEIDYVETHGVGSQHTDSIELQALAAVLGRERPSEKPLIIGSVKSNIGHLEWASGMAALLKVVLSLKNGEIPSHLHLKKLNPEIAAENFPFVIPTQMYPWPGGKGPRVAGINSFGIGGTNVHMILEQAPPLRQPESEVVSPFDILTLSARSPEALKELADRYAKHLDVSSDQSFGDICYTAGTGRSHLDHRLAVVASSARQAHEKLVAFVMGQKPPGVNVGQCTGRRGAKLTRLRPKSDERRQALEHLAKSYVDGTNVDWSEMYPVLSYEKVDLPTYPFQRKRYWIEEAKQRRGEGVLTRDALLAVEPEERRELLESYLGEYVAGVVGTAVSNLDLQQPLNTIGFNSLMAIEFRNVVERKLEVTLPIGKLLQGPSVRELVKEVLAQVMGQLPEPIIEYTKAPESSPVGDSWVVGAGKNAQVSLRLFCLSQAGGGPSVFSDWNKALPPEIEVCAIQLPGHEGRIEEAPFDCFEPLVQTLAGVLQPYLKNMSFAIFGHSIGALIGFELARQLRRNNRLSPVHLFVSAFPGPRHEFGMKISDLPDEEFIEEVVRIGGIPQEVLNNAELMSTVLPALRADFKLGETYQYQRDEPLDCPISAFGGLQDRFVRPAALELWRQETVNDFSVQMFPGGHLFFKSAPLTFFQDIARKTLPLLKL